MNGGNIPAIDCRAFLPPFRNRSGHRMLRAHCVPWNQPKRTRVNATLTMRLRERNSA
ncbi:hypothetical protein AB395_00003496 [Sinorhizobium fredii CCBAU 45436]|nr:hypothetical protein AB395_00003496 [Sinorhizobium fredii CCBAU 45436]